VALEGFPLDILLCLYSSFQTKQISTATCLSLKTLLCSDVERNFTLALTYEVLNMVDKNQFLPLAQCLFKFVISEFRQVHSSFLKFK
jgi:hypothetical protein